MEIYRNLETVVFYCIQASSPFETEDESMKVRSEREAVLHAQLLSILILVFKNKNHGKSRPYDGGEGR